MRRDPLRKPRLEHEGHRSRQLDRLQFAIAGVIEGLAVRMNSDMMFM
jgi:phage shock protein PspC (stress-responsive transcriptional regulator)